MQIARIEAVTRGDPCRFVIDAATRRVTVVDSSGAVLHDETLDRKVQFTDPDGGPAITLNAVSPTTYDATFSATGAVIAGAGTVYLAGGDDYRRITLFVGGGTQVEHREGTGWVGGP